MEAPTPTARELFTDEQLSDFLSLIRDGVARDVAARSIGATGRLMRSLARPTRDPLFAKAYEEAEAEGAAYYPARLESEARARALAGSDRLLEVELATHHPGYAHLRRDRVRHEGRIEHGLTVSIDPAVLDTWPTEKLEAFQAYLAELSGEDTVDIDEADILELPETASEAA